MDPPRRSKLTTKILLCLLIILVIEVWINVVVFVPEMSSSSSSSSSAAAAAVSGASDDKSFERLRRSGGGGGGGATVESFDEGVEAGREKDGPEESVVVDEKDFASSFPSNSFPYGPPVASAFREGKRPCSMTAVVLDPRMPRMSPRHSLWAALESLVVHGPDDMCLLLQTSSCDLPSSSSFGSTEKAARAAHEAIVRRAPTKFSSLRAFLKGSGRARTSIIDHEAYRLKSCRDFFPPSRAWMSARYWGGNEFAEGVDADLVLTFQSDAVLCRDLDPDRFRDVAYVGAPWRDDYTSEAGGMCGVLERRWRSWWTGGTPPPPLRLCDDDAHHGPVGNGGLSLRSRAWMVRAVRACPSVYAGVDASSSSCRLNQQQSDDVPEDNYFGPVLRGIGAPVPTAFEAALFASEMVFPDTEATVWHGPRDERRQRELVEKRMGKDGLRQYDSFLARKSSDGGGGGGSRHFLPIGIHKFWFHHDMSFVVEKELHEQCPYLRHIVPMRNIPHKYQTEARRIGFAGKHT